MKTNTYLRWSLLIPILVWLLCLLFVVPTSLITFQDPTFGQSNSIFDLLFTLAGAYFFGIIFWIVPYVLLSLILFFSSFLASPRVMITLYTLSPLAMLAITLALMNIFLFAFVQASAFPDMAVSSLRGYTEGMLAAGGLVVLWGYICVCIGYGIYRLLKSRGIIRDEQALELVPQPA
jgi:hypothetical protein